MYVQRDYHTDLLHFYSSQSLPTLQDKLDIRQAVDGGHVVSGLTEVVVKDKEQVNLLRIESGVCEWTDFRDDGDEWNEIRKQHVLRVEDTL